MVRLFSLDDDHARNIALTGLLAGLHALNLNARSGLTAPADMRIAVKGLRDMVDRIKPEQFPAGQHERLVGLIDQLVPHTERSWAERLGRPATDSAQHMPSVGDQRPVYEQVESATHVEVWNGQKWTRVEKRHPTGTAE